MRASQNPMRSGMGEGPVLRAGRRGPLPGGLWAAAVLLAGLAGFAAPRALGLAAPAWVSIVLATALALAVAGARFALIVRRRRKALDGGAGQ